MTASRRIIGFINVGHMIDHMFMLIFPTAVLGMQSTFARPYSELIALALGGFIAFGAGSYPAGWLGDRWNRRNMMAVFFVGIGMATFATGLAQTTWQLAIGLTVIGLFAAIYHPVGTAMLVSHTDRVGRAIGVNGVWGNLGVAFAALVTGGISQWLGWRYAFMLPGVAAIMVGILYIVLVPTEANQKKAGASTRMSFPRAVVVRAFLVLALVTLAGGVVFNATTVALPKLIDERLPQLGGSTFDVGLLVCAVYVVGAMSQLVMGWIIDRQPLKVGFVAIAVFQAPFLAAAAFARGWLLIVVVVAMVFAIFGQVTFNDGMVARYANSEWRARVYAVRYLLSFGVSALAIPLVAFMHAHGGFTALLEVLSLCSLLVLAGAVLFPYRRDEIEPFEIRRAAPVAAE